ncbi:MAG: DUF3300 domain-containing protein [Kangiellaceae bacterium]|nr:DUF3300 domain-containing protein [Kangiellaceae bacterium]MCW8997821.1 DUF3300 domain-containing protein [Kangiellaceae bacterium]MCW9017861.1 DUF3300 domain-containing protein [Kangiellaceae bacterium]
MKQLGHRILGLLLLLTATFAFAEDDEFNEEFSEAELEQMLAPIALYPDSVLTHILIASTYPLEVIAAERWASKNSDLEPDKALERVENKSWDPSVKALVPFPRLLSRMSENLEWTQKVGDAFLQDEAAVLASIQTLRSRADQAGNLEKMEHMEVLREDDKIIIQPVEREVVYVPYYDTRVVYGHWYWAHHPPIYWNWHWRHHHAYHGPFYWHPRVHVHFSFFRSAFHWHNHHVIIINDRDYWPRRYFHRRHILSHRHATRWAHRPVHRRGVSYRTERIRERYHSNRPSVAQTRVVRRTENNLRLKDKVRSSSKVTKTRVVNNSKSKAITRQERLKQNLQKHKSTVSRTKSVTNKDRSTSRSNKQYRDIDKSNSRNKSTISRGNTRDKSSVTRGSSSKNSTTRSSNTRKSEKSIQSQKPYTAPRVNKSSSSRSNSSRSNSSSTKSRGYKDSSSSGPSKSNSYKSNSSRSSQSKSAYSRPTYSKSRDSSSSSARSSSRSSRSESRSSSHRSSRKDR